MDPLDLLRLRLDPDRLAVIGDVTAGEAEVPGRLFAGDRLRELPAQRSRRLVV